MALSAKQLAHLSKLARVKLTDKDTAAFQKQLTEILDYMEKLKELKTDKVKPTAQTTGLFNIMRKDNIDESLPRKEALRNAPEQSEGFFKVKSVFD